MNLTNKPKLSAAKVRTIAKPGRYHDGHGLMLVVQRSGSRQWIQRIVIDGKRRDIGLGGYPLVTLAEAREKAFANRRVARSGGNPLRQSGCPTFAEASRKVHTIHAPALRNAKYRQQWIDELERHAFPILANLPVDAITMRHVMSVIEPIWHSKPKLSKQLRQRIEKIMDWVIVEGHRNDNPAGVALKAALPANGNGCNNHHEALPHGEVGKAIDAIRGCDKPGIAKLACEFLILTAARSSEVREAQWSEIDLEARTWTVPAERMKANREHRVPLSDRAIEILNQAREHVSIGKRTGLIFAQRGKVLSESTFLRMIKDCGYKVTAHGFRSSFRDWCSECTDVSREVAEAALAHTIRNQVEAAYARSDLFDKRAKLMQQWADYVNPERSL